MAKFRPDYQRLSVLLYCVSTVVVILLNGVSTQVLTPPYFNLAEGRRIVASDTCGEEVPEPELFCKLVGADTERELANDVNLFQGQFCDYCDPKDPNKRHPAEAAVDGRKTWWQSPPLSRGMSYNEVNLTIDLGQLFHVAYVVVKMGNSPRPRTWILERSSDNGQTYHPWQYFADNLWECQTSFGVNVDFTIKADDTVICSVQYSNVVPLDGGEIVVPLVSNRPSANDFFNSTVLQEWTKATHIRFRLLKVQNLLGHYQGLARQDSTTTRRYYYSIEEISIGGRCRCNGHAETCTSVDRNDPYKLECDCKDNTCGPNCETCCPGFEQKKWSQSKTNKRFICERCNCFGHSDQCVYNETVDNLRLSLDLQGVYEGGGVCQNCQHNTEGINCNKCVPSFYKPWSKKLDDIDVCQKCQCDYPYSTGNCEDGTGRCECKPEYTKPNCDSCSFGHFGYPMCRPCECYPNATTSLACRAENGSCPCKANYKGHFCRVCAEGFYHFPDCKPCDCNGEGSVSNACDLESGDCKCKNSYGGRTCDQCSDGYYSFPKCNYCNCDTTGTLAEICDKTSGQCLCKPGYGGPRCDQCTASFTGFPDCKPCNCSLIGSAFTVCDATGKCTCFPNFAGKLCDRCGAGYYSYPNCTSCNCDAAGSVGTSCNNDGSCTCKPNFDGEKCDQCKVGFYNYPICEACKFNPAGVVSSFTGCNRADQIIKIDCKTYVQGKECGECKELYWNLQAWNPKGCEDCGCNTNGTVGRLGLCDSKTGQCLCKQSTKSRQCDQCVDGYFNLKDSHLFGCTDCDCDIGGSISNVCNKNTGNCMCQPRVTGRTCKEPLDTHYFPTLHQYQFEIEDGITAEGSPVRYGFDEAVFPGYSWKGYAVYSSLQSETIHEVMIDRSSIYRIILRYINPNAQSVSGIVSATPEQSNNVVNTEQKFHVLFKPSKTPTFTTVAGIQGNVPSPFVLNPGPWRLKIKIDKSLFVDYFVIIPADYYEASLLVSNVTNPCVVDKTEICRHYAYPSVVNFDQKKGSSGYLDNGNSRSPIEMFFNDPEGKFGQQRMVKLSNDQPELYYDMTITQPATYVLIITYATLIDQGTSVIEVEARTQLSSTKGMATIYNCRYTMLCRAVVIDRDGKIGEFKFDSLFVSLKLKGGGNGTGIDAIIAIPKDQWSLDYVQPKPACIRKDNVCIQSSYQSPPESRRVDFKTGNENRIGTNLPSSIFDNNAELIYLDHKDSMVDVSGKVPKPGPYIFVVHYYQPDYPEFDMEAVVHNGQFYEAKLPVHHCPNNIGCRSVLRQSSGNNIFQLTENFVLTLKEPNHKSIWLHYVLVIQSSQYNKESVMEAPFDQTARFISQCANNSFYLDTSNDTTRKSSDDEDFCREATFSLTTKYNHGALSCHCDYDGSASFQCAKFGGQCPCRKNIIGRTCSSCKTGYFGFPNCQSCNCSSSAICDVTTGECICPKNVHGVKCNECVPYTFGFDQIHGCRPCNCHVYGVKNDNVQCDLVTGACDCKPNIEGRTCDRCVAGFYSFPTCRECDCDPRGITEEKCNQTTSACFCKNNVQGPACDVCKDSTFNLESDNPDGCTKCFCFGRTTRCRSSNLFTSTISVVENWTLVNINASKNIQIVDVPDQAETKNGAIYANFASNSEGIIYFAAPTPYLGNKLTSYGSNVTWTILYSGQAATTISGADLILYGADTYLLYETVDLPVNGAPFFFSVKIIESNFITISGQPATREELMPVLQNLTAVYIKATYAEKGENTKLQGVTMGVATSEYTAYSNPATAVEQCGCPSNYEGLSCEECADGYYRIPQGPFGGLCVPCQCNGHASSCDKTTGICQNCKHNTVGDHCEKCERGFYGNATIGAPNDCLICACPLPTPSNNFATGCDINEAGDRITCDCITGYAGGRCERCAAGFYGRPEITGDTCVPCQCNGNIDPSDPDACDHVTGRCLKCLNNASGDACDRCAPGFFGDAVIAKDCQPCLCDKCGTKECNHKTGECVCHENVVGEKCDRCADQHYGYTTCKGCTACKCDVASESMQCDDLTGNCRCKDGVMGRTCDRCAAGYWKYSPDGCTSCGCNTGYSVGVGCNVSTGKCECLPGVVGEKCDSCPYRNVLIPNEGCFACDKCAHGLLDTTDELRADFQPILNQFKTESIGYFTAQRLKFINDTYDQLAPKIVDVVSFQFDITPYEKNVSMVETEADNVRRSIASIHNDALISLKKGNAVFDESQMVNAVASKVDEKTRMIVSHIDSLSYGLETRAGPQIDDAIKKGQKTLADMNSLDLDEEKKTLAEEVSQKAKTALSNTTEFSRPMSPVAAELDKLVNRSEMLKNKLDDLEMHTDKSQKTVVETIKLNQIHKSLNLPASIKTLNNYAAEINNAMLEIVDVSANSSNFLDMAQTNFEQLANSSRTIKDAEDKASNTIKKLDEDYKVLNDEVRKAAAHAAHLENQAKILESHKEGVSTKDAVKAANSYKDIVSALGEATNARDKAKTDAEVASEQSKAMPRRVQEALSRSTDISQRAVAALADVQQKLNIDYIGALQQDSKVSELFNQTLSKVENIQNQLKQRNNVDDLTVKLEKLNADEVSEMAQKASNSIQNIKNELPMKLDEAKRVYEDRHTKRKSVLEADNFVSKIEVETPKIIPLVEKLKNEPQRLAIISRDVNDTFGSIEELISTTRDLAARITVGVSLTPNTVLELPIPSSLLEQGSSTDISLYFNTSQPNALLLYLGSEFSSRQRAKRSRTDDFLAIELQNGYVKLTIDLGEKKVSQVSVEDKRVDDNNWYNVRVERTGKLINLTVTEETKPPEKKMIRKHSRTAILRGSHFVLNLDKDSSKLFVGGLPPNFENTAIGNPIFHGHIEELTVDGIHVGLWNFVHLHNAFNVTPSMAITGTMERNVLVQKESSTGCRFLGKGYVKMSARGTLEIERLDVVLQFKTTSYDGLLFLMYKNNIFTSIELRAGYIYYQYNVGEGIVEFHTPTQFNDDKWHRIEADRFNNDGLLKVDGEIIQKLESRSKIHSFELPEYVYVGGYSGDHKLNEVTKTPFEGCIDGFALNSEWRDLNKNYNAHGIVAGCPERFSKFISFNEGYRGYVRWPRPNILSTFSSEVIVELSLRIRTKAQSGLITYGTDGMVSFSLLLFDGGLKFRSGKQEAYTGPNIKYNDDKWHSIMAFYDSNALHLLVDDFDMFKSSESMSLNRFNAPGRLYFGTVPSDINQAAAVEKPFVGCIGDATFNGVLINFDEVAEGKDVAVGRCFGPVQQIKTFAGGDSQIPFTERPTETNEASTPVVETAVTVAPGSLPLVPAVDKDITKESGYRFGTAKFSAHTYNFDQLQLKREVRYSIEMKTVFENGIIFYVTQPQKKDFFALYLKDSRLHFKYHCIANTAELTSDMNINQGEWHTIDFEIYEDRGLLRVDGQQVAASNLGCKPMNIGSPYYVGGMDVITLRTATSHLNGFNRTFIGCLRKFKQNDRLFEIPSSSVGVISCSSKVEEGTFFSANGGYIKANDSFNVGQTIDIKMEIKPRNLSGVLLAVHAKKDYLILQMVNGSIKFTVENGNGAKSAVFIPPSPFYFVDGSFHKIQVLKQKNVILLTVDGSQHDSFDEGKNTATDTRNPLYIGGYPAELSNSPGIEANPPQFVGCMRNVEISTHGGPLALSTYTVFGDVTFNVCPTI